MPDPTTHPSSEVRRGRRGQRRGVRYLARALGAALGLAIPALLLAGCSSQPDPEQTRSSLKDVTDRPAATDESDQYDATKHQDPVVESLPCSNDLLITARGTAEPPRNQLLTPVAKTIAKSLVNSQTVDLDYPADTDVKLGGTAGVRMLIDTLNLQAQACPDQRFVLLGYSQGAFVVGDALSAPDARLVGEKAGEVDPAAADRVVAVVLYGNPRFDGTEGYDAGDYEPSINGILPRPVGALTGYHDRIRDYCVDQDFVCQGTTQIDEKAHVAYYSNGMQAEGAAFAIERFRETDPGALKRSALGTGKSILPSPKPGN